MTDAKANSQDSASKDKPRSWIGAISFAAIAVAVVFTVAVIANLAIGRVIHWDIVTILGSVGFVFLTIGRKYNSI
jgi:hypothetical protein